MSSLEQRVENQVQFWSLIGPFLLLVTIAVLLFKLSAHWYFPFAALIGIPLCVKWKLKGMAAALSCLFAISLFSYQELDLDERYWHVGMTLAMAFSFIILTLSLEEVAGLVEKMQRESQSRLDNFLRLDETTKKAEAAWFEEKSYLNAKLASITHDLAQAQEEKQVFYKLAQLSKDELVQTRTQQDLLQQELFYKKIQLSQLDEKLDETEMTLQGFINSDAEQKIQNLTESLEISNQRHGTLQAQINALQKQLQELEREKLINDANAKQDIQNLKESLEISNQRHGTLQAQINALQKQVQELEREKLINDANAKQDIQNLTESLEISSQSQKTLQAQINALQKQVQELEREKLINDANAKQDIQNLTESLEISSQSQETLQVQINALQKQLQELEREKLISDASYLQELKKRGAEWQQDMERLQEANQQLRDKLPIIEQEKEQLQETFTVLRQQYEKVLNSEIFYKQSLENQMQISSELETKLSHHEKKLTWLSNQNVQIEEAHSECKKELEQTLAELDELKNRMSNLVRKKEELSKIDSNTRDAECLYIQLRKQFQDKSDVLDQTRKELFAAQEAILRLEKEEEEKEIFSQTESEAVLLNEYSKLLTDYERMQQEIECLESLVHSLINS